MLSFQLSIFSSTPYCEMLSGADTGVVVAIAFTEDGLQQWVPLLYFPASFDRQTEIFIGNFAHITETKMDTFNIRGYTVPAQIFMLTHTASVNICGVKYFESDLVQFRWLQTTRYRTDISSFMKGIWRLDHINVAVSNGSTWTLLDERFDDTSLQ